MKNQIDRKKVTTFLEAHREIEFSAAKFEYTLYLTPEIQQAVDDFSNKRLKKTEEDIEMEKLIEKTVEADELVQLMRKPMSGLNRTALREKILEQEEELISLIKKKCLRNKQSIFIENVLYFFLHSKTDYCNWILQTYSMFSSEYLKSMLCLVLGFRGEVGMIPFLMEEAQRFEREYPEESFDQGPVLAVQELAVRFLN